MGSVFYRIVCAASLASLPVGAQAQTLRSLDAHGAADLRVAVGVSIPLGGTRERADNLPRLDLRMQRAEIEWQADRRGDGFDADGRRFAETRLSLTFENNPRLLLNGVATSSFDLAHAAQDEGSTTDTEEDSIEEERRGRTTLQKIGLGAAIAGGVVALGIGAIVIAYATSDDSD